MSTNLSVDEVAVDLFRSADVEVANVEGIERGRVRNLVWEEYELAAAMSQADLEKINRVRPPELQYGSVRELVRERWAAAGAISRFAVDLGLLSPDDDRQILLEILNKYPELKDLP